MKRITTLAVLALAVIVGTVALLAIPACAQTVTTTEYFTFGGSLYPFCLLITQVDGVTNTDAYYWCPNQTNSFTYPLGDGDASLYLPAPPGESYPIILEDMDVIKGVNVPMTFVDASTKWAPGETPQPIGSIYSYQRTDTFAAFGWTGQVQTLYHNQVRYCGGKGGAHRCDRVVTLGGTGWITRTTAQ